MASRLSRVEPTMRPSQSHQRSAAAAACIASPQHALGLGGDGGQLGTASARASSADAAARRAASRSAMADSEVLGGVGGRVVGRET